MRDLLDILSTIDEDSSFQIGDEFGISLSEDFEIGTTITDLVEDGIVIDLDEEALEYLTQNGVKFLEGELVEAHGNSKVYDKCWKGYKKVPGKKRGEEGSCVKEEDEPANPREADMLDNQVAFIKYAVDEIEEFVNMGGTFPEWFQNKISGVHETVKMLHAYTEGEKRSDESTEEKSDNDLLSKMSDFVLRTTGQGTSNAKGQKIVYEPKGPKIEKPKKDDNEVDEAEYQGRKVQLGKKMAGDVKKYKVYVKNPKGNVVKVNFGDKKMRIKKSNPKRRASFRARHNCSKPGPRHKARYWSCRNW